MLGHSDAEFGNTPEEWFKRVHPEEMEFVRGAIAAHLEKGSEQFEIQHRMLHRDGLYRWMLCCGRIVRDDTGRPVRITGFHSDITVEKVVDPLTGLPNRLLLMDRLHLSLNRAKRDEDFLFAVLAVDPGLPDPGADTFEINSLMAAAARRLEAALRTKDAFSREGRSDLVARSGSDRFAVLLEGFNDLREAGVVAERLLQVLRTPFSLNGCEVSLSPGIGIALGTADYRQAEEILRDADAALYRARSLGKSRCEIFDIAPLESARMRRQLEKDLSRALGQGEILLYYQPIVSLSSQTIVGFEALARWMHPSRGMVMPAEFIPAAQKTGVIVSFNRWALREACRTVKAWRADPRLPKDVWISINLSAEELARPDLAKELSAMLLEFGIDASGLMLELTEGSAMENPEAARNFLMQMRVLGARVGLDDFGTGYSSLSYLRRLPLDFLKIDSSFVRSVENSPDSREIIRAVNAMARQLGLRVVAEGIETANQLELVRSLGCDYGQGFLFSRAVPGEEADSLLMEGFPLLQEHPVPAPLPPQLQGISPERISSPGRLLKRRRKLILSGLAALFLLTISVLLTRPDLRTSSPVASTSPVVPPASAEATEKTAGPLPPETPPVSAPPAADTPAALQQAQVSAPKARKVKAPEVYTYPVRHDHRIGGCKGILRVTRKGISFVSEKSGHSFDLDYTDITYAMDRDRLTIRHGSKAYNFESSAALNKDENRSLLREVFQKISGFHPAPAAMKP